MTKTTIGAERDYVNERLCGVNDMTFEEWLSYQDQMLRYYNTYQYDSGLYEEEYYPSEDESQTELNHWKKTMNQMTIMTTMFVCAIQSILKQAIAVVMPEAKSAMANEVTTIIPLSYLKEIGFSINRLCFQ